MLEKLIIINAPIIFKGIWNIVKYWVDKKTRQKIEIYWSNDTETLLKYIDAEKLPKIFGGKCTDNILDNSGPWKSVYEESLKNNFFYYQNPVPWETYFLNQEEKEQEHEKKKT